MNALISVEEARRIVQESMPRLPSETVSLSDALARTLSEPVVSRDTIPPFDNAGMDGYTLCSDNLAVLPVTLPLRGEIAAGSPPGHRVEHGTCLRIMTGAPVPEGADVVIPVEWTEEREEGIVFTRDVGPGTFVRRAGEDVRPGDVVIPKGEVVVPAHVGMMATLGYATVRVARPPHVAILTTGDELVPAYETPAPGQIRDSNGPMLAALVRRSGGEVMLSLHVPDDPEPTRLALEQARAADVILLSGGVSMGNRDYVRPVLDALGFNLLFWGVKQKPGKPLAFGLLGDTPLFALPGNPVSTGVCFDQYVRPALGIMLGRRELLRPLARAILEVNLVKPRGLHHFVRATHRFDEGGRLMVRPTGAQGSNLLQSLVKATCLLHLPEETQDPIAGDQVAVELLG